MWIAASNEVKNILFSSFQPEKSVSNFEYLSPRPCLVDFTPKMHHFVYSQN